MGIFYMDKNGTLDPADMEVVVEVGYSSIDKFGPTYFQAEFEIIFRGSSIFDQNSDFWPEFQLSAKSSILDKNSVFWTAF